ncbi:crossover junction endodeoxyribonuclease RuvC [Thermaurantiacus sp.]
MTGGRPVRLLGLDPGLAQTGWGVILVEGARLGHVAHGVLATLTTDPLPQRLATLHCGLADVIAQHAPDAVAIEEVFQNRNPQSTLKLGEARGVALLAAGLAGLVVHEVAARFVKKALTGTGAAEKTQVAYMVQRLLPAAGAVAADAADALAVAIAAAGTLRPGLAA